MTFGINNISPRRKREGERRRDRDRESRKEKQEIAEKTEQTYEPKYKQYVQSIILVLTFQCSYRSDLKALSWQMYLYKHAY